MGTLWSVKNIRVIVQEIMSLDQLLGVVFRI